MLVSSRLTRKLHQVLGEDAKEMLELMQQDDSHRGELREILVRMEGRFTGLETQFTGLETRFAGLETRFTGLETRLTGVETRLTGVETRLTGVETRLTGVELKIAGVETMVERRSADLIKWSFVFWVGAVAAIAMLARVLP